MLVRYFAGAAAAAGRDEQQVAASQSQTFAELVAQLSAETPGMAEVFSASTLLADGVRIADLDAEVSNTTQLDVLPPFAGG